MKVKPPSKRQQKKISKLLGTGEEAVLVTSIGSRYFWMQFMFYLPFSFILIGLPKLGNILRVRQSYTYALTNRRFLIIRGLFTRKIVTAPLERITHITVEQSFLQRYLYNTGDLIIITAGFDQKEIIIENIANPVKFKILIEELTANLDIDKAERGAVSGQKLRALSL